MARRVAFVVNASTGAELSGGSQDAARMFALLTRTDLGRCEPKSPPPLHHCQDRETFTKALLACLAGWRREDQLILYYSGHGGMQNGKYVLRFGEDSVLPFENVMTDLQVHGVVRAIVILDACQSGEVLATGRKGGGEDLMPRKDAFPRGIALVTSCRERESSYELLDGSASVFTSLLAQAIETGLDGRPTVDGRISVHDAIEYINAKMATEDYEKFPQTPVYGIHEADRSIWLARNPSAQERPDAVPAAASLHTLEELRLLYENTAPNSRPCPGCTLDDLDWTLVERFAARSGTPVPDDRGAAARELGLYSRLSPKDFTRAAVLCFARHPHSFLPQARSVFVAGDATGRALDRTDVLGPLSVQIGKLVDLVEGRVQSRGLVARNTSRYMLAVREALSNGIAHRDYALPAHVTVRLDFPTLKVVSPGALPPGLGWQALMESEPRSNPTDPAIAWYLTALQAAETIGRGFDVYRAYRREAGSGMLTGEESPDRTQVTVAITYVALEEALVGAGPASGEAVDPSGPTLSGEEEGDGLGHGEDRTVWEPPTGPGMAPPPPPTGTPTSPSPTDPLAGHPSELAGCRILRVLGEGGGGAVYLAHEPELNRTVAIKTLFQRFGSTTQRERFLREARSAAGLSHPGIVSVYRIGEERDYYYIVMRYVEGRTLEEVIREEAPLPDAESVRLALQIADALSAAHGAGVIHRDMKPGNVIVDASGNPNITDFGIAQVEAEDETKLTRVGAVVGTPAYASPEQIQGLAVDERTDIYSLGVILYEMLTGRNPYAGMTVWQMATAKATGDPPTPEREPPVDDRLGGICRRALEPDREKRFASAAEMAEALAGWESGGPEPGPEAAPRNRSARWWRFSR